MAPTGSVPTGVVLAGGDARRFGGAPKGLARVHGARIIDRVADALRAACDDLLLVANAPDATDWLPGVRVVADVLPGRGALGGLHAALAHASGPVIVVAWDMPFVPAALLGGLRAEGARGAPAVVPEGTDGPEPLCAYYGAGCRAAAESLLGAGERRARALGAAVGAVRLDAAAVARYGDPRVIFRSVNTPADLAAAAALASLSPG
ncbi:MAG TPA: molybdenum cofactor guanylyltransferase [Gemmatirosa sp.]